MAESPGVTTEAASEVTFGTATLNGKVNPHGFATTYRFEYGTTVSYGTNVPVPDKSVGSGSSDVEVSEGLTGLQAGTTYHFRLAAFSTEGSSYGKDETLKIGVDPRFSLAFGSAGFGNGQFYGLTEIAIDVEDDLWITDYANNRVQEFNSAGEYLAKFGSEGMGNGQFLFPTDIAVDSVGNLWVTDTGNNRVEKFSSTGEYLAKFGSGGEGAGQFVTPEGIAIDSKGDIWVADTENNRIQKFNPKGEYLSKFGIWGEAIGQFGNPKGFAIDSGGKLWIADAGNYRVQGFSPKGEYLSTFGTWGQGPGQFGYSEGIAIDSEGSIWVADASSGRVQKWIPTRPVVTTEAATGVAKEAATLNAIVNPNGVESAYRFEYGTTTSYGTSVPVPDKGIGSGLSGVEVNETLSGLKASTTYHFRVVATNAEGTSFGKDETFATK